MLKLSQIRAIASMTYNVYLPSAFGMQCPQSAKTCYSLTDAVCYANEIGGYVMRGGKTVFRSAAASNVPFIG